MGGPGFQLQDESVTGRKGTAERAYCGSAAWRQLVAVLTNTAQRIDLLSRDAVHLKLM